MYYNRGCTAVVFSRPKLSVYDIAAVVLYILIILYRINKFGAFEEEVAMVANGSKSAEIPRGE